MRSKRILACLVLVGSGVAGISGVVGQGTAMGVTPATVDFHYTGGAQTWVVPAGVTSATFDVFGAQGGDNSDKGCTDLGGRGGHVGATISVTPGQSIDIVVGGVGGGPADGLGYGGFNGGDSGGTGFENTYLQGGGGGGSSDVRTGGTTLADRTIVAGGGGGASGGCDGEGIGGPGGGTSGGQGSPTGSGAAGGGGATVSMFGAGGTGTSDSPGGDGALLSGGPGGNGTAANALGGGGGGGGFLGGGGGAAGSGAQSGGGGGGSGFCATTCSVNTAGVDGGDGLVTITYTVATPPTGPGSPGVPLTGITTATTTPLSWKAPLSDGGSPVTGYEVSTYANGSSTPTKLDLGPSRSTTMSGLTPGTRYRFSVAAINAVTTGPASALSASVFPPFASAAGFTIQQYHDFSGRAPSSPELKAWVQVLGNGTTIAQQVVKASAFSTYGPKVDPLIRLYYAYFGVPPSTTSLKAWLAKLRAGTSLATVSTSLATNPKFATTYAGLSDAEFVSKACTVALGHSCTPTQVSSWATQLNAKTITRSDLMLALAQAGSAQARRAGQVNTVDIFFGMIRRAPTVPELRKWAPMSTPSKVPLITHLFGSASYGARL
jgi:hypothetical protein